MSKRLVTFISPQIYGIDLPYIESYFSVTNIVLGQKIVIGIRYVIVIIAKSFNIALLDRYK